MDYYKKYIKYKTKYLQIKTINQKGGNKDKFFFVYNTTKYDNLLNILKTGVLKISSKVSKKRRFRTSGKVDNIYGSIYFKDLENLSHLPDYSILLSEKLLEDYDIRFNKGWTGNEIISINKDDKESEKYNKLEKVKEFLKDPKDFPEKLKEPTGLMMHEAVFNKDIPIKEYLIGIVCNSCSEEEINKIKKYTNVKIYTTNLVPKN